MEIVRLHPRLPIFWRQHGRVSYAYVPGHLSLVTPTDAYNLRQYFFHQQEFPLDSRGKKLGSALLHRAEAAERAWNRLATEPFAPECLTVYLSNHCNLGCVYCYSAAPDGGRAPGWPPALPILTAHMEGGLPHAAKPLPILDISKVRAGARHVAGHCAAKGLPFTLVLHGGGEPTLHFSLLEEVLDVTRAAADEQHIGWWSYLATNGMVTPVQAEWLAQRFHRIGLSCDGPPDLQNQQRPFAHGGKNSAAILEETAAVWRGMDYGFAARATITSRGLTRQTEIALYLHAVLGADELHFEPAYRANGPRVDSLAVEDAELFVAHFLAAAEAMEALGCPLHLAGVRLDEIHGPYCDVLRQVLRLTPDGAATACFLATDSRLPEQSAWVIGQPEPIHESMVIDAARVAELRWQALRIPARCTDCVNIYHCARECPDVCTALATDAETAVTVEAPGFRCRVQKNIALYWLDQAAENIQRSPEVFAKNWSPFLQQDQELPEVKKPHPAYPDVRAIPLPPRDEPEAITSVEMDELATFLKGLPKSPRGPRAAASNSAASNSAASNFATSNFATSNFATSNSAAAVLAHRWRQTRMLGVMSRREMPVPSWAQRGFADDGTTAWQTLATLADGQARGRDSASGDYDVSSDAVAVYVHVPFCDRKCGFCDCYALLRTPEDAAREQAFAQALLQEVDAWSQLKNVARRPVSTVHFGGGTPNYLREPLFATIVERLRLHLHTTPDTEWALESTSSLINAEHLQFLEHLGFRRLHVGVQTLEPSLRPLLGRREQPEVVLQKIALALARGWIVSVDLLFGVPGETIAGFTDTLADLMQTGVHGFSLYSLNSTKRNQVFARRHGTEQRSPLHDFLLFQWGDLLLTEAGYRKNHFTHYALPADRNLYYTHAQRNEDLLALGPSADGVFGAYRYRHGDQVNYVRAPSMAAMLQGGLQETADEYRLRPLLAQLMAARLEWETIHHWRLEPLVARWLADGLLDGPDASNSAFLLSAVGSWKLNRMMAEVMTFVGNNSVVTSQKNIAGTVRSGWR